jgi:predicted transcriptional regulator of viral defense system
MRRSLQDIVRASQAKKLTTTERAISVMGDGRFLKWKDLMQKLDIDNNGLAQLMRDEVLIKVSRGLYTLDPDLRDFTANTDTSEPELDTAHLDMFHEVCVRMPKVVINLLSAASFHDIVLDVPSAVWFGIRHGSYCPKIDYPPTRPVTWRNAELLNDGVDEVSYHGTNIQITSLERTVVDLYKYSSMLPDPMCPKKALASAMEKKTFDREELIRLARKFGVEDKVRSDVEIMDLIPRAAAQHVQTGSAMVPA